jgi:hypothetical protein
MPSAGGCAGAACALLRLLHYSQLFLLRYLIVIGRFEMHTHLLLLHAAQGSESVVQTAIQLQILSVVMVAL